MSQTYADIIIDISHSAIDRVFQYRIGDAWEEQVQVGSLVTVPFGKGNAHRHGYVIGITQTPSYEPDKIKEIVDVPQKGLPIEGKLTDNHGSWQHPKLHSDKGPRRSLH